MGKSEKDIAAEIADRKAEQAKIKIWKEELEKKKKNMSKDAYNAKKKEYEGALKGYESIIKNLNTQMTGTIAINAMLDKLRAKGELNGLTLNSFSLSTDPKNDFSYLGISMSNGANNAFVLHSGGQPSEDGQIFIDTNGQLYQGATNGGLEGSREDWILYVASTLRHEQWHRDAATDGERQSERLAYREQLPILQKFRYDFSSSSFYDKRIKTVTQKGQ